MFRLRAGWTKERALHLLTTRNNGTKCFTLGHCTYVSPDHNHCAIGCFIPDGHRGMFEIGGAHVLLADNPDLVDHMPLDRFGMWELQMTHDHWNDDPEKRGAWYKLRSTFHPTTLHDAFRLFFECFVE